MEKNLCVLDTLKLVHYEKSFLLIYTVICDVCCEDHNWAPTFTEREVEINSDSF